MIRHQHHDVTARELVTKPFEVYEYDVWQVGSYVPVHPEVDGETAVLGQHGMQEKDSLSPRDLSVLEGGDPDG